MVPLVLAAEEKWRVMRTFAHTVMEVKMAQERDNSDSSGNSEPRP